jgi:hypothetical protein
MRLPSRGILIAAALLASPAAAEDWSWSLTPYLWMSEIGLDASVNDHEVLEREADLADVMDGLDFALQLHLEGQRGRHGVLLDLTYWDMGDDDKRYPAPGPVPGEVVVKGDLETTILEAGGIFDPKGDGTGFSLLYGARLLDMDQELDARYDFPGQLPDPSRRYAVSGTLLDGMIGVRYAGPFAGSWSGLFRADLSAGDTELTWNALAGVGYALGSSGRYTAFLGYRYMEIELEEEDARAEVELQNKLGGFITGLRIAI